MTFADFSNLGELTDDLTDRIERDVDALVRVPVRGPHRVPENMYCSGHTKRLRLSGFSQASVQALRSIRAGLP